MACENKTVTVSCYGQNVIHVINAHYGRLDNVTCESNIGVLAECLVSGTRDIVYNRSVTNASVIHKALFHQTLVTNK